MTPAPPLILDTHAAIHELVEAGMPEPQAETVVRQQAKLIEQNFATRHDIEIIRQETATHIETLRHDIEIIRRDIETLRQDTKHDTETLRKETAANIEALRQDTRVRIETAKVELIKWMVWLNVGVGSLVIAAIMFLTGEK